MLIYKLICTSRLCLWISGQCILNVWHHGSPLQPCKCPICRRFITLLIPTDAARHERRDPDSIRVLENIAQYNRRYGGGPSSLIQVYNSFCLFNSMNSLRCPSPKLHFLIVDLIATDTFSFIFYLQCGRGHDSVVGSKCFKVVLG